MIVLDASIVVELLTSGTWADSLRRDLAGSSDSFIVPHLLDVEVASALRKLAGGQHIDSHRSEELLVGLATLPAERYSHIPLLGRIWELRHNFTAYDAAYIALAEATNSVLYTSDEKLCKGHHARVALFTHRPPNNQSGGIQ
jgi:predicted nucleic acid-binding protein